MGILIDFIIEITTIGLLLLIKGPGKLFSIGLGAAQTIGGLSLITTIDAFIFAANMVLPYKSKGAIVAKGDAGYGGIWPEFVAPTENDSRSPCPYLSMFKFALISSSLGFSLSNSNP